MSKKFLICLWGCSLLVGIAGAQSEPNLVGYWNFDDGTAMDLSGNGNDGQLMGNAMLNDDPGLTLHGTGMSLDINFDNSNTDWLEVPHSDSLNITRELSLLMWIRPDEIQNWDGLIAKGITTCPWALRFNESAGLRFSVNQWFNLDDPTDPNFVADAKGEGDIQSTLQIADVDVAEGIDWTFVGVVSDGQNLRFIRNDEEQILPVSLVFAQNDEPLTIGVYFPAGISNSSADIDYYNGLMDEIRVYNRAVTRREVLAASGIPDTPFAPEPVDGAEGIVAAILSWGRIAGTDKLYVGTDPAALELAYEGTDGTYTVADVPRGVAYYWRVDVDTADGTVTGDVWTFSTAGAGVNGPSPEDASDFVDVSGISLGWLPAFGSTAYDVYFGTDAENLALLDQVTDTAYADATQALVSETVYYWRVDAVTADSIVTGPTWSFTTRPVFPVEDALVGWYKFELGQGTTIIDWARRGNDGFIVGNPQWVSSGFAGSALSFDGDGDYVQIPRVVEDDWTIMLWLRTDDLTQGGGGNRFRTDSSALIDGDFGSQLENFALTFKSGAICAGCTTPGVGAAASLSSDRTISDTEWHSVAWTRNAETGEMVLYIDGSLDVSGSRDDDAWKGTKDAQDHIKIGLHDYSNSQGFWTGELDEIKFFTRVLDEREVQDEMRPDKRQASQPSPYSGQTVDRESVVTLSWRAGDGATAHNVYLGSDPQNLTLVGAATTDPSYEVGLLSRGTHYWQVGEIMPDTKEILSQIWRIEVIEYLIVDNFETYGQTQDDDPVWGTWMDGFATGQSGSQAGDSLEPFVEINTVYAGQQALPLLYDNTGFSSYAAGAKHSEVYRIYEGGTDFTRYESTTLRLWFYGGENNVVFDTDVFYVAFQDTSGAVAVVPYVTPEDAQINPIQDPRWQEMSVDLTAVTGVDLTAVERFYIGIGDRTDPVAGSIGRIVVDEIRLYP